MATTVDIKLASVRGARPYGAALAIVDSITLDDDLLTSSASSQQSDFSVPATTTDAVWVLTVTGGNIRALFGANPTATQLEAGGWLILAGQTREFAARAGDKCAIIDA